LKTYDFLRPLEEPPAEETSSSGGQQQQQPRHQLVIKQHALPLPGSVSIRPAPPAVKAEPPLVLWGQPTTHPVGVGRRGTFSFPFSCVRDIQPIHRPTARDFRFGYRVSAPGT
jgi:hypothetical protein